MVNIEMDATRIEELADRVRSILENEKREQVVEKRYNSSAMSIFVEKLEPVCYKGESNPIVLEEFLFKVEQLAKKKHFNDREKLDFAIEHLEDKALAWLRVTYKKWSSNFCYNDFLKELRTRFYSSNYLSQAEYDIATSKQ